MNEYVSFTDRERYNVKVAVIGGGASGLTAAISAAKQGAQVTVFEKNNRVGKKILMTGNGKCNLSNKSLSEEYYYSGDRAFVLSALEKFGFMDTVMFFNGLGLLLTEKNGGIYPHSEQASSVLDALRFEVSSLGINLLCDKKVDEIVRSGKGFTVKSGDDKETFDRVIIACGGKAAPATGSDGSGYKLAAALGHSVLPTYPALAGIRCEGDFWKITSGVRCAAALLIENDESGYGASYGELQFTDYGISGIPAFQISRIVAGLLGENKTVSIDIDLFPEVDEMTLFNELSARIVLLQDRNIHQILSGVMNKKLATLVCKFSNLSQDAFFSDDCKELKSIISVIKHFRVHAKGVNPYEQAQCTAGGIPLSEIDGFFESKICKGLYLCGEILDVDGLCGGYNLQWAWTSGHIAGEAASGC